MVRCSALVLLSGGVEAGRTGCNSFACKGASEHVLPLDHPMLASKQDAVADPVHLIGGSPGKAGVVWTGPVSGLFAEPGTVGVDYCESDPHLSERTCIVGTEKFAAASAPWTYQAFDGEYRDYFDGHDCPDYKHEGGEHCMYHSPPHYKAQLDLKPQQVKYLYKIRGETEWRSFRSTPALGQPVSFGVIADLGQYNDSLATMDAVFYQWDRQKIDTMLFGGDISYANGVGERWDTFGRLQERLFSRVLTAYVGGNHESEKALENWIHYTNRYPAMHLKTDSRSPSDLFYSFDVGLAHVVMLCSMCPTHPGSDQHQWILHDLAQIDRSVTPWVIGVWHSPWYNSNTKHPMAETDDMRAHLEDLVHDAGFDIVFSGHNHAYERTTPIYKNVTNECEGAIYIMVGDAGGASPEDKDETHWPDQADPEEHNGLSLPWITPENPKPPLYDQPEWSLVRAAEWGFGGFQIFNASVAEWTWYNSYDSEHAVKDSVTLVHKRHKCSTVV
jgi:hypothetical protein